jgi:hypothetical protein
LEGKKRRQQTKKRERERPVGLFLGFAVRNQRNVHDIGQSRGKPSREELMRGEQTKERRSENRGNRKRRREQEMQQT